MVVRWVSAAIVEAQKKFGRVQGWRDIEKLVTALEELEAKDQAAAAKPVAQAQPASRRSEKIKIERDNPASSRTSRRACWRISGSTGTPYTLFQLWKESEAARQLL